MFPSLAQLRNLCGGRPARRGRPSPVRSRKARLQIEALEERAVPTILFMPHFGAETLVSGSTNDGMQHPTVNLVFSGNFWNTAKGQQDEATVINSTRSILSGPYLSGLTQYGSDGKANFGQSWIDTATLTSNPPTNALQNLLQNSITNHHVYPGFNNWQHAPIYIVISDPNSAAGFSGGWNAPGTYHYPIPFSFTGNMRMVWVGTHMGNDGHIVKDWFTMTLSHEIAETISDPDSHGIRVNPPSALPTSLRNGTQIGDNEPEDGNTHYGYRLGGDLVQPYWSVRDGAYIVPDGNVQKFYLYPIWNDATLNLSNPGASFTATFNLNVTGDQLGVNYADRIQIGGAANVSVTMNKESAVFEPGAINSINVNTAGGSNRVEVYSLGSGVTLNLDSYVLNSNDSVVIGAGGSLAGIQGTINVANHSGQTSLFINDTLDGAHNVTITDHSVAFAGLTTINYEDGWQDLAGGRHGVTSLAIDAAFGSAIDAESVGTLTNTYLYWYPGLLGFGKLPGLLSGPAAAKIHVIFPAAIP